MQLSHSFSFLLTALLFTFAQVEASPTKREPGIVTLPLRRLPQPTDVHPSILLQQHVNRSYRRHARMTGREGPSDAEMVKRLEKRLDQISKFDKRYDHNGTGVGTLSASSIPKQAGNPGVASGQKADPKDGYPQIDLDAANSGGVTKANTPTAANSIGLNIIANDVGYAAVVQVGTPLRDFSIIMDSGSADFWIGGEGCKSESGGSCGNHVFLGSNSSSTFKNTGKKWEITYGSGHVTGDIVTDNVKLAGLALDKLTFGVALVESSDFTNDPSSDGLLGLAMSTISNQGLPTPVEVLAQKGLIGQPITSYKISRLSDGLNDGEITFGGLDKSKYDTSTLATFKNVNRDGFWEGNFTVSVNGKSLGLNGRTAILDTGTTLIIAPAADAKAIHAKIPGSKTDSQGDYIIPCTNTAVVSFSFGGRAFDINPLDLLFVPVDDKNLKGDCYSGIAAGQIGTAEEWLLGDVFLKNVYFSHNVRTDEISLAKLV